MLSPLFFRLASRLQEVYQERCAHERQQKETRWVQLNRFFEEAQRHHRLRRITLARGWSAAVSEQQQALNLVLRGCQDCIVAIQEPVEEAPSIRELVAELVHLHEEFETVSINWKNKFLAVRTNPIVFSEINLGRFEMRLRWPRLIQDADVSCFEIFALEPNPAGADSEISHPHVKDRDLCAGDAIVPLQRALEQGRIVDAFCLVRSVLENYNPHSAHATLDNWGGYTCWNCSAAISEDERSFCEGCDQDMCDGCTSSCKHCGRMRCDSCQGRCEVCKDACCRRCLRVSACSELRCCKNCLYLCSGCDKEVARTELDDETDLCDSCRKAEEQDAAAPESETPTPVSTLSGESDDQP